MSYRPNVKLAKIKEQLALLFIRTVAVPRRHISL
jgi:hypothetical protein